MKTNLCSRHAALLPPGVGIQLVGDHGQDGHLGHANVDNVTVVSVVTIMAQVAVLQMNMERAVVTSMKAASSRLRPVPATSSTRRAKRRWIPTF